MEKDVLITILSLEIAQSAFPIEELVDKREELQRSLIKEYNNLDVEVLHKIYNNLNKVPWD